jgi:hypothetical protein
MGRERGLPCVGFRKFRMVCLAGREKREHNGHLACRSWVESVMCSYEHSSVW